MISQAAMDAYTEALDSGFFFDEALGAWVTMDTTGARHQLSRDETSAVFYDRIERSKACGRNLFFEELPLAKKIEYDRDTIYG